MVRVRMDKETVDKLDCLVNEQGSDRSKIIRQGIELQYKKRNRKECKKQTGNFLKKDIIYLTEITVKMEWVMFTWQNYT